MRISCAAKVFALPIKSLKVVVTVAAGTVLGLVLSATSGETPVGVAMSFAGLGISQLAFVVDPWLVYLVHPILLIAAGYLSPAAVSSRLRGNDTSALLRCDRQSVSDEGTGAQTQWL